MKKILLLLLLATFGMQAQTLQNPTYGNVKLKNNTQSTTATKVNVQETDGTINTKPLSELDNYLEFTSAVNLPVTGEQGKLYLTKDNNRLYRFNGTIYQELTTDETTATIQAKRPLKTIENQSLEGSGNIDLSKSDVGLGNVDNTSDANKPISTATQTALNGKENSFTKNTAFNKNFGTTAGTVAQGNDSRILNGQTAFSWGNHASAGYALTTGSNINQSSFRTALGLGSNAYSSTPIFPIAGSFSGNVNSIENIATKLFDSSNALDNYGSFLSFGQSGYTTQINSVSLVNGDTFIRVNGGGSYGSWRKLWHDGSFNPANYLPLSGGIVSGFFKVDSDNNVPATTNFGLFLAYTHPKSIIYIGDGSGYSFSIAKKTGGVSTDLISIADNGNLVSIGSITATAFFQSSDRRLKTILKRDGDIIYFKWKDGRDDKIHIGYIAQEVRRTNPDQVQKGEDKMLSVNYVEILVEKIRVLEKRIEQLEKSK